MILGGYVFKKYSDPESWAAAVKSYSYGAAYCPIGIEADDGEVKAYAQAAEQAGIVIAEVGAWSNPISPNEETRLQAQELCKKSLALADEIGACCCVNIAGSRSADGWYYPHPDNLTEETFDMIVEVVRDIIDAVKPVRTFYALETMSWIFPDSPESYFRLMKAIDRDRLGVHFDPVNMICSPNRFFNNAAFLRDCFEQLGPYVKSCHAKDIALGARMTVHLDEVRPGLGALDYKTFLRELERWAPKAPLMIEHLETEEEYALATDFIRSTAGEAGVAIR